MNYTSPYLLCVIIIFHEIAWVSDCDVGEDDCAIIQSVVVFLDHRVGIHPRTSGESHNEEQEVDAEHSKTPEKPAAL